jgi:hypothetical protein
MEIMTMTEELVSRVDALSYGYSLLLIGVALCMVLPLFVVLFIRNVPQQRGVKKVSRKNNQANDNRVVMRDINPGDKIKIGVTGKLVSKIPVRNTFHDWHNRGAMVYEAEFSVTEGPLTGQSCKVITSESDRVDRIFVHPDNISWWDKWVSPWLPTMKKKGK